MNKANAELCMGCMEQLLGENVCPKCGYDSLATYDLRYKRPGQTLSNRYIVGRLFRKNGESALYLGYDTNLQRKVWIREYYPYTLAKRDTHTGQITPVEGFDAQYKTLMSDFMDICDDVKKLSVNDPVIPIENALQENNTVYAIYKYMQVVPLEDYLTLRGGKIPFDQSRNMLLPICNTISKLHAKGELHRGISPYTVFVDHNGRLYLWDFSLSATRTANSELEAELFNGYSAPEQYSSTGWQGAWSDVYALAALLYRSISGFVPPKSTLIGVTRTLTQLEDLVADLPREISGAVASAMQVSSAERTPMVCDFTAQLMETKVSNTAVFDIKKVNQVKVKQDKQEIMQEKHKQRTENKRKKRSHERDGTTDKSFKYVALALLSTVVVLVVLVFTIMRVYFPDLATNVSTSESDAKSEVSEQSSAPSEQSVSAPESKLDRTVPPFVGKVASDIANDTSYNGRFKFSIKEEFNDTYPVGTVYDQLPLEGIVMANEGTVILYVSKGTRILTMPALAGMDLEIAAQFMQEEDLAFEVIEIYDEKAAVGTVVRTTPDAQEEFNPKETSIYIFICANDNTVKDATSSEAQATSRMTVEEFERLSRR